MSAQRFGRRSILRMALSGAGVAAASTGWWGAASAADAVTPDVILKRADEVRNPAESYFVRSVITSSSTPDEPVELEVSIQGNTRTLVRTIKPSRDRGRLALMVNEDMWAYVPNLKRAVRVSLGQRLVGQAANGDISRCRWSGDYTAVIESETVTEWVLLLAATKRALTYDKIRAWIEKGSFHPLRAEYLTPAGKPLKRAVYRRYAELAGSMRPSELHIEDALRPADYSDIRIVEIAPRQFPASIFYPENLQ